MEAYRWNIGYYSDMLTFSLQSGSNGNSIYVEAGDVRLLFDAGISGAQAQKRMAIHDRNIRDVNAVIISHDHIDHIRSAGIYQRKFNIPIYITRQTLMATRCRLGHLNDVHHFRSGETIGFHSLKVHTFATAHDAADGVVFVVEWEKKRLGILTDLGHPSPWIQDILESVDAAYLECNYDPDMLESGNYPEGLKARIRGDGGHTSNVDSAMMLKACGNRRPNWIAVAHLSQENNRPELAIETQLNAVGKTYPVYHASRYQASEIIPV